MWITADSGEWITGCDDGYYRRGRMSLKFDLFGTFKTCRCDDHTDTINRVPTSDFFVRTAFIMLSAVLLLLLPAACVGAPVQPTLPPGERPTATPIGEAPEWTQAKETITLQNVQQIRHLGR